MLPGCDCRRAEPCSTFPVACLAANPALMYRCRFGRGVEEEKTKSFAGPVTIERSFKVDGKKLTVLVTFPATAVQEVGMEALLMASNRAIVTVDSKAHKVEKFR